MNKSLPHTAFFLAPPASENSGVDFLGLRQANLDMMADMLPGTNNVTPFVRPFSLLSWIFWKFHKLCEHDGNDTPTNIEAKAFRERIEILFTWGAKLVDAPSIPGKTADPPVSPDGQVELTFDAWGRVQTSTSLIAALWYGPASKTLTGFGFLDPVRPELFRTSGKGIILARELDQILRNNITLYSRLLNTLSPVKASADDAAALWKIWGVENVTDDERSTFRQAMFNENVVGNYIDPIGKRSSTIALAQLHLKMAAVPQSADDVRRGMYYAASESGAYLVHNNLTLARKKWITLQMRQLQRLSFETLFSWSEFKILGGAHETDSMTEDAAVAFSNSEFGLPAAASLGALLAEIDSKASTLEEFATVGRDDPLFCPFTQMEVIHAKHLDKDDDVAASCVYAILLCAAFAGCADKEERCLVAIGGPHRMSLTHLRKRFTALGNIPLRQAIQFILEAMVISQHMATAVNRFDGQNQRLRLSIEETGLEAQVNRPWNPTITEDRLPTILRLSSESGAVNRLSDDQYAIA